MLRSACCLPSALAIASLGTGTLFEMQVTSVHLPRTAFASDTRGTRWDDDTREMTGLISADIGNVIAHAAGVGNETSSQSITALDVT